MWQSDLLSVLGDHAAVIALAVLVYGRSHSAIAVAITSAAAYVPAFGIGPILATYADRFAYRPVMIACDLVRAASYGAILIPGMSVSGIVLIVFLAHCATFPFSAARAAQLTQIADAHYGAAQRLSQSTSSAGALVGYALGGALVAVVGANGAIMVNAASFLLSGACVYQVRARARTERWSGSTSDSALQRMTAGVRSLLADRLLFWPAVMVTSAFLGTTGAEAMAVVVARKLRPTATDGGPLLPALLMLPVAVALLAMAVCPKEGAPRRLVRASGWMVLGAHSFAIVALILSSRGTLEVAWTCAAYAVLGVSSAVAVPCVTVVGQRLPADNRASVFSLLDSLLVAGQATGALLAGVAVARFGVVTGICLLLLPAIVFCALGISRMPAPAARHQAVESEASPDLVAA